MAILSLNEIMEIDDITESEVEVPQWQGSVVVRSISHREMKGIKKELERRRGNSDDEVNEDDVEKFILIKGLINPTITEEDYERLLDKSTQALTTILNGILGNSKTGKDSVKQEERNFPSGTE